MKLLPSFSFTLVFLALQAYGEVKLVREYLLKPPRDRRIVFEMAVTPEQDVLSLLATDTGAWRLSRIRHWLDQQPIEESLTVPGLVQGGREAWSGWSLWSQQIMITADGRLALCILSANHGREREDLITVVNLDQFKIVTSARISALVEVSGNFRTYKLDRRGYLVVNASTPFPHHPGDDPFFGGASHKLATLALPHFDVMESCEYSEWMRSGSVVRRENESDCARLLKNVGVDSLDELPRTFIQTDEVMENHKGPPPGGCAFLTYMSHISRDGRLRREFCTGGHRGFFGNFVVTGAKENIFSVETGQRLGSIKEPNDHPLKSRFATLQGRDYLLVMEGGTRLWVYRIL